MSTSIHWRPTKRVLHIPLVVAMVLATLAVVGVATAPPASAVVPPVVNAADAQVSADPLPTVQINGVVWDQEIVGSTVYAVGNFSNARPAGSAPGANQTPRSNVLAYNLTTGQLLAGFVANTNAQVKTVKASPDGSRIYIGGQFTTVNGTTRYRMAALNPTTGAVITAFNAITDYTVNDLAVTNDTVYAGGAFGSAGPGAATPRSRLAAFSATKGALLPWNPSADGTVQAMVLSPDGSRVFAGGAFKNINGQSAYGMGALHSATGAVIPWAANTVIQNGGPDGAILDLTTDGTSIYGNGYTFGRSGGNLEGVFKANATTGAIEWVEDCHGDTYQAAPVNGFVYTASHAHFCGNVGGFPQSDNTNNQWHHNMRHTLSFKDAAAGTLRRENWSYHNLEGLPAPSLTSWYPDWAVGTFTGQGQATWAVDGNADYVVFGGEFTGVNGLNQQGLVRFARRPIAPKASGPRLGGATFPIKVVSPAAGQVRVSLPANYDRDDAVLTYRFTRNGATVHTTQVASTFWDRPTVSFHDSGLTPGQTYTYRVNVTDRDGNAAASDSVPVTVATTGAPSPYANRVVGDGARIYWRLGDAPGSSTAQDSAAFQTGAATGMTFGRPGAIVGDTDTAASPNGTSSRVTQPPFVNFQGQNERHPTVDEFSVEAWFRTASTQGGRILGFGNSNSGNSGSGTSDRHLYVTNNGRVMFGVRTRAEGTGFTSSRVNRTIESAPGLNNGQWHHVVGTLASGGMRLYVDGVQVASRNDLNSGHGYYGYWRVGADTLSGWTSLPSSTRLNGDIDEAAVYYHALNGTQAEQHFALGRGLTPGNVAPTASFTAQASNLTVQVNGSGSSDPDGTITSYAWNFGDGGTATGATASHSYAAAGTYTVTLTVTDNQGAVGQNSQPVTVTAPAANVPPTASFTHETSGLELSVNASGSSDPDGTIESYGWNFGDGGTGTGTTASHTYAAAGTYTVTLTVTDDDGATDADSKPVTVTEPGAPVVLAADGFGRQVTNGLGIADVGGAWTTTGSTTNYAVVGGVGTHRMQVAGSETSSFLSNVSGRDVVAAVDLAFDKPPTGSGVYVTLAVRRVGTSDYRVGVRASPTSTSVTLYRLQNTSTTLAAVNVPGLVYASGDVLRVEFAAVGNGSTSLGAKVWRLGSAEPAAWQVTAVDTTPALQGAGGVGLVSYLSGSSTNAPLTARYDNLLVTEGG